MATLFCRQRPAHGVAGFDHFPTPDLGGAGQSSGQGPAEMVCIAPETFAQSVLASPQLIYNGFAHREQMVSARR